MKNSPMQCLLICLLGLLILPCLRAQDTKVVRDFRTIIEAGARKEYFDHLNLELVCGLKLEQNSSNLDEFNMDLNGYYSPMDFIHLGAGYRLTADRNRHAIYEIKHRYQLELELTKKISRYAIGYRVRYQNVDDEFFQDELNKDANNILRNRLQVKYKIKKSRISPFAYSELFGQMAPTEPFPLSIRSAVGGRYSFGTHSGLRVYFRIDLELNAKSPYTFYNMGFAYMYKF